jgi:predicted nucleotidyltransferase
VSGAHSARLLAVAERLADEYWKDAGVVAVLVAGSAGSGEADEMSDLDLVVLWRHAPSDDARRAPIEAVDGEIEDIAPFEEEEWAESFAVGDVHVGTSMFLAETVEHYLDQLLLRADPTDNAQILVAAVQHALVLHGEELVADWRERAATYPEALARAVAVQSLQWQGGWGSAVAFAARGDLVALGSVVDPAIRALLRLLLALNRIYLAHPRFKSSDWTWSWVRILTSRCSSCNPCSKRRCRSRRGSSQVSIRARRVSGSHSIGIGCLQRRADVR